MKNQKKPKRKIFVIIFGILIFLVLVLAVVYGVWKSYYNKSNYIKDEDVSIYYEDQTTQEGSTEESTENSTLSEEDAAKLESELAELDHVDTANSNEVYNILLIGSDRRDTSWYGNSDSMILISVNESKKKIYMTSFMRDLYVVIPNIGARKLNSAYARGAGPLLVQTLEENFKIDINNYASVDFTSMSQLIDLVGGVDLELYQEEADYLNNSIGTNFTAGMVHMNGEQALAFSRIRYVGYYDYERTSMQRCVLEQVILKARQLDLGQLNQLVSNALPLISHNISEGELAGKLLKIPEWIQYEIVQDRVPYDGLYSYLGQDIVPNYAETIQRLHNTIYGQ